MPYTEGPWTIEGGRSDSEREIHAGRWHILTLTDSGAGCDFAANAKLAAASPELADALLRALPYVEDVEHDESFKRGVVKKHIKQIRDVLTKAGVLK